MARSQRVLSGSLTKGSTATPSGSIIFLYQGVNAKTDESYFGSLLPRIGSGDRLALYRFGKRLPQKTFDDSITMNSDPADIRGEGDDPVSTRIDFRFESRNFGQLDQRPEGYSFIETREYDAVGYLQDPGTTMWPVNLFNASMLPKYEYDGVIEPLDIRAEILGILDTRYEGHSVRGALMGAVGEGPLGSRRIKEAWFKYDPPAPWFLDAPDSFGHDRVAGSVPWDPSSYNYANNEGVMPLQAFQNLDQGEDYPFVERDYQNEVYAEVTSHNPGTFIPVLTPTNWNYALTSSFQSTEANGPDYQYVSTGSLLLWQRYDRERPAYQASPGSGGYLGNTENEYTGSIPESYSTQTLEATGPTYITTGSWFYENNDILYIGGKHASGGTLNDLLGGTNNLDRKPFTIAMWIYPTTINATHRLITIGYDGTVNGHISIYYNSLGRLHAYIDGDAGSNYVYTPNSAITTDTWQHVVITYTGKGSGTNTTYNAKIFIDGIESQYAGSWNNPMGPLDSNYMVVGARQNSYGSGIPIFDFVGNMAELAIWTEELPQTEIRALYNASVSGIKSNRISSITYTLLDAGTPDDWQSKRGNHTYDNSATLVAWWRLGWTQTPATAADASGNNNNGSEVGAGDNPVPTSGLGQSSYIDDDGYVTYFNGIDKAYLCTKSTGAWGQMFGVGATYFDSWTVSFWIKEYTAFINQAPIFAVGDNNDFLLLQTYSTNRLQVRWSTTAAGSSTSYLLASPDPQIDDGDWHHVVLTCRSIKPSEVVTDGSISPLKLYVDGVYYPWNTSLSNTSLAPLSTNWTPANEFYIATGNSSYTGLYQKMMMMDFAIWSMELSQEAISALYKASFVGVGQYSVGGTVYSSVVTEQNNDMTTALQLLNSASYRNSSDPLETRAHHGFYFGQKAGSITYGDI